MRSEPISYLSLKTVLQHMEANLRFQVSMQIPCIRTTEKAVPLKINDLTFNGMNIVVNKTKYELGVYRKYHDDNAYIPDDIKDHNDMRGAQYNFDQYGLPDFSSDNEIMTPGDVGFIKPSENRLPNDRNSIELRMHRLEVLIERLEEVLAETRSRGEELLETTIDAIRDFQTIIFRGTTLTKVELQIKSLRAKLVSYHCWRDNNPPPFVMYTQFTIRSESKKQIRRMKYNKRLYQTQKDLNSFLFGKRLFPIQVNWFGFYYGLSRKTVRLPIGLRFKIQRLHISHEVAKTYELLKPILEPSSFPLKCLHIRTERHINEDFNHAIVTSAEKLEIRSNVIANWRTVVPSLPNRRVDLKTHTCTQEDYISLVQNWLDTGRQVGSHFSLGIKYFDEYRVARILALIKQQFNVAVSGKKSVTLRMNDFLDLKIFYRASTVQIDKPIWVLDMKVVRNEAE